MVSTILLIISFILQNFMSLHIGFNIASPSIFSCNYVLITLVILLGFYQDKKRFLKLLIIFGLMIDIIYTNTYVLNTIIFLIIYYAINFIYKRLPHNLLFINIISIISMIMYHFLNYTILNIISYDVYGFNTLLHIILCSIIMSIMYGSLTFIFINYYLEQTGNKYLK